MFTREYAPCVTETATTTRRGVRTMIQYSIRSARHSSAFGLSTQVKPIVAKAQTHLTEYDRVLSKRTLLSPPVFRIVWWSVCSFHVFCGGFSLALGGLHALLATPNLFEYTSTSLQTPLVMLHFGAVAMLSLGALHICVVARMFTRSVRQRQLAFVRLKERKSAQSQSQSYATSWRRVQLNTIAARRRRRSLLFHITAPLRALYLLWRQYFSIDGLFGLNGQHFDTMFTVREVVEILSQLYQTYLLSVSVVTPWVNKFAIAVVLINSVSGVVIRLTCRAMATRVTTRHLVTLVVDVTLDFCSSMLIPVCILYQVVRDFDWTTMKVPLTLLNSDVWLAGRIAEVHLLIITSTLDLISMLALHIGILGAMLTIAADLRRDQDYNGRSSSTVKSITVVPLFRETPLKDTQASAQRLVNTPWRRWLLDLFFLSCGASAIAAHLCFQRDSSEAPFCLAHVDAWFVQKFPCAVVRFNCHRFGANDSVAAVLQSLDKSVLVSVSFAHCAGAPVDVPLALTEFQSVRQLKFINVSAIHWDPGVVIDETHFPRLAYVLFGRTNMSSVPSVLLHNRLPSALREIEWSYSNLSSLPDEIGRVWAAHEWFSIVLDHTKLTTLPSSFASVHSRQLSLVDSRIEMLPDEIFGASSRIRQLIISGSPVRTLPASLGASKALEQVMAEHTEVAGVPDRLRAWSERHADGALSLYGSPVCEDATTISADGPGRWCSMDRQSSLGVTRWNLLEPCVPI